MIKHETRGSQTQLWSSRSRGDELHGQGRRRRTVTRASPRWGPWMGSLAWFVGECVRSRPGHDLVLCIMIISIPPKITHLGPTPIILTRCNPYATLESSLVCVVKCVDRCIYIACLQSPVKLFRLGPTRHQRWFLFCSTQCRPFSRSRGCLRTWVQHRLLPALGPFEHQWSRWVGVRG